MTEADQQRLRLAISIVSSRVKILSGEDYVLLGFDSTRRWGLPSWTQVLEACEETVLEAIVGKERPS